MRQNDSKQADLGVEHVETEQKSSNLVRVSQVDHASEVSQELDTNFEQTRTYN
jgi:uncharacterized protein (DUF1697 family)